MNWSSGQRKGTKTQGMTCTVQKTVAGCVAGQQVLKADVVGRVVPVTGVVGDKLGGGSCWLPCGMQEDWFHLSGAVGDCRSECCMYGSVMLKHLKESV